MSETPIEKDSRGSKSYGDFSSFREGRKSVDEVFVRPSYNHKSSSKRKSRRTSITKEEIEVGDAITQKIDRISGSNKKFHKRFDLPDEIVIEDYICAILLRGALLSQGSMYITHNYVCFYSNIFGKRTVVAIPFSDILLVRKATILKIPNSIEIITPTKNYFWASFLHRDNAFELIENVWKIYLSKEGKAPPNEAAAILLEKENQQHNTDSDLGFDWKEEQEEEEEIIYPPISDDCKHEVQLEIYTEPIYTQSLPISAMDYYWIFLSEKGMSFWKEFHDKGGYLSYELESWKSSSENCCFERKSKFKAPIGFSKYTRVTQQQRIRFTNDDKVIFETSSFSKDVPYSNHFLVESKWIITNVDDSNSELKIYISVKFIKRNWLKRLIESGAIEGSKLWFDNWIKSTQRLVSNMDNNCESAPKLDVLRKSIRSYKTPNDTNVSLQSTHSSELTEQKVPKFVQYAVTVQSMNESVFLVLMIGSLIMIVILFFMLVLFSINHSILSSEYDAEFETYNTFQEYFAKSSPDLLLRSQKYGEAWRAISSDIHRLDEILPSFTETCKNLFNKSQYL